MTAPQPVRLEVPPELAGQRFDRALDALVPDRTRAQLQKLVRRGRVRVDGEKVVRSNFLVRGGERLALYLDELDATTGLELRVLYEDEDLVAVDKAPRMLVHPNERLSGGTLSELAVERYGPLPSIPDSNRPGIVHRLDRDTSGVIVLARTAHALDDLREQFQRRQVEKRYLALVHGMPEKDVFEVVLPLGPVPDRKDEQRVHPRGKPASTRFRVLERFRQAALIVCEPLTGRRHQIRVHLTARGLPILGDKLYRPRSLPPESLPHHALHAERLALRHPVSGEPLVFEADPPETFSGWIEELRAG